MIPETIQVTSEILWLSGLFFALLDLVFLVILVWRVKKARFRLLRWPLAGIAAVLWGVFGTLLVWIFWDSYYQYFFPAWLRAGGILFITPLLYAMFAFVFHWFALRLPGNPILGFCLLAGIESIVEHLWGIYGCNILEIPMFVGIKPIDILVIAAPEYIFYWCVVISIAVLLQNGWQKLRRHLSSR